MTVVTIRLKDVGMAADVGPITFRATRVRGDGADGVTTRQEHTVTLDADGQGEVNLSPGPVRVSWKGYSRTCDVPETGPISLAELLTMSHLGGGHGRDELLELVREVTEGVAVVREAASSASWDGDRLTVLGATSPPLPGPPATATLRPARSAISVTAPDSTRSARTSSLVGLSSNGSRPPGAITRMSRPWFQPFHSEVTMAMPPTSI